MELCHYGMAQRWLVVSSQAAMERAEASLSQAQQRAWKAIETPRLHWHAKRFATPEAAQAALTALSHAWRDHQLATSQVLDHQRDAGTGRPTPTSPLKAMEWQMQAQVRPVQEVIEAHTQQSACFIMGTHIQARNVSDAEVIRADKAPSGVEGGFRFLQDPVFFVASLFVKKPCRIAGLLMVMTLAVLVYSLPQRRWRQP
jgi:transposase